LGIPAEFIEACCWAAIVADRRDPIGQVRRNV